MNAMPELVSLSCAQCGAPIEVNPDAKAVYCLYCKSTLTIQRTASSILLTVNQAVDRIVISTDKTAAELALVRLPQELKKARSVFDDLYRLHEQKHNQAEQQHVADSTYHPASGGIFAVIILLVFGLSTLETPHPLDAFTVSIGVILVLVAIGWIARCVILSFTNKPYKPVAFDPAKCSAVSSKWHELQYVEAQIKKNRQIVGS